MVATLTPLPDPPARLALSNDQFVALMDAWMIAQKLFQQEMNDEVIPGINAVATAAFSGTSTTSLAIGTGSKSLSMQSGRAFSPGQTVIVAHDGANYMRGTVTAYDTGAGALSFTVPSGATVGSGTFTSWSIALGLSAADLANYLPLAGGTLTGLLTLAADMGLVLTPGAAPSSKQDGHIWRETSKLLARIGAVDFEVVLATLTQTLTNKTLTSPTINSGVFAGYTEIGPSATTGTALSPNLANGTLFRLITNGNATITLPTPVAGKSFTVVVEYGGTHTLTWAGGTRKWVGGTVPTPTSANGKIDVFTFVCLDGSNWLAFVSGQNL